MLQILIGIRLLLLIPTQTASVTMFQLVNKPTHIHRNILDLVITSDPDLITDLVVHSQATYSLQSDHFMVTFSVCAVVQQQQCRNVSQLAYDFNKADWNNIDRFIVLKNGDAHFYSIDVEIAWARLKDLMFNAMNIYIPKNNIVLKIGLSGLLLKYSII